MKASLLDTDACVQMLPALDSPLGRRMVSTALKLSSIDKVNDLYSRNFDFKGADFAARVLDEAGIKFTVQGADKLSMLPDGAFITISNHPYGGLDGVFLIDLIARIRPDFKVMVNKLLGSIKTLEENFITVVPNTDGTAGVQKESIGGVRKALEHLRDAHPLGLFPSGAVSDLAPKEGWIVRDRPWQDAIIKLIAKAGVPVVPIRFFDGNSKLYYRLGLIDWKVRLVKLPSEVFNKSGQTHRVGIGDTITPGMLKSFNDPGALKDFLRSQVYDMTWNPESDIKTL